MLCRVGVCMYVIPKVRQITVRTMTGLVLFKGQCCCHSPLTVAVLLQLYRMANSPNAVPGRISPSSFPLWVTSSKPPAVKKILQAPSGCHSFSTYSMSEGEPPMPVKETPIPDLILSVTTQQPSHHKNVGLYLSANQRYSEPETCFMNMFHISLI